MKKSIVKAGFLSLAGAVLVVGLVAVLRDEAHARPNYKKEFEGKYPGVAGANKVDCNVCHYGTDKKNRNDYGAAFGKALPAPKCTDSKAIGDAFTKAEAGPSSTAGKTFGDLLKDNKLPGKAP